MTTFSEVEFYNLTEVIFVTSNDNVKELCATIEKYYKRNKSLADTLSKCESSMARLIRSVTKSATQCGCIEYTAKKQKFTLDADMKTLVDGELCDNCQDIIKTEAGTLLFYVFALCIELGIDVSSLIENESDSVKMLGKFNLK